jgi:hypothetical protein
VISLLVAIINARRAGVRRGDPPTDPIVIVRRAAHGDTVHEETILRIGNRDPVDPARLEAQLEEAAERVAGGVAENERLLGDE